MCTRTLRSVHVWMYVWCVDVLLFPCVHVGVCKCARLIVHVNWFSVYVCGLRQKRQGIMNCAFIPSCTAPFTYPHGEDGVELACQCQCLVALHAVCVLLVSKGIKLGEQALWHH